MNEYTLSKIQIIKADPNKWKPAILQVVPANQLPVHFGGTLTDPDGNPRLTTKVISYFLFINIQNKHFLPNPYSRFGLFYFQKMQFIFKHEK